VRSYWENVGEHIGNLRNMLEPIGTIKSNTPSLPPKKNNLRTLGACWLTSLVAIKKSYLCSLPFLA